MIRTIFLAAPGAGKGTQAEKVAAKFGAVPISTGDALRLALAERTPIGLQAKEFMDAGELVPDEVVLTIVQDKLRSTDATGWILDGFPRNKSQAISLEKVLTELEQDKCLVIYLEVEDEILIERIAGRYKELGRKDDADPNTVANRLEIYKEETLPLIKFYSQQNILRTVNGNRSVDHVFDEICLIIKEFFALEYRE